MRELRGHHIFCTRLFSGSGYDPAFTKNMQKIVDSLQNGESFTLCTGHDQVCAACPNRTPEGCSLGTQDVARRDQAALAELGLSPGQELDWRQAAARLAGLDEEAFQRVCGACRWQKEGLCSWRLLHARTAERSSASPLPPAKSAGPKQNT